MAERPQTVNYLGPVMNADNQGRIEHVTTTQGQTGMAVPPEKDPPKPDAPEFSAKGGSSLEEIEVAGGSPKFVAEDHSTMKKIKTTSSTPPKPESKGFWRHPMTLKVVGGIFALAVAGLGVWFKYLRD